MIDYYYKYIKYKNKYLSLKNELEIDNSSNESIIDFEPNNLVGGGKNIIIHISGPSGAGKTTLGDKLIMKYGDKIVVKDIDNLRLDFIKKEYPGFKIDKWNAKKYQEYIDNFIKKNNKKPLVFVGLNHMPWWNKNLYYNMRPDYKFYIKLNAQTVFKQKCGRFIEDVFIKSKERMLNDIIKNEDKTMKHISTRYKNECSYEKTQKMNEIWNRDYKLQGYKFFTREQIFDHVCDILNDVL
jgi:adenylate kinase family enzyme